MLRVEGEGGGKKWRLIIAGVGAEPIAGREKIKNKRRKNKRIKSKEFQWKILAMRTVSATGRSVYIRALILNLA